MLLESLKPLQLKSNVILQSNDVAFANTTTVVPANSKRHSIIFGTNTGNLSLIYNGVTFVFVFTTSGFVFTKLVWDDFGDIVRQGFSILWPVGANQFYLTETYTEERPDDQ